MVSSYAQRVSFVSSDSNAVLPAPYAFTPADVGTHAFSVTFATAGVQTVTVRDDEMQVIASSETTSVGELQDGGPQVARSLDVGCGCHDVGAFPSLLALVLAVLRGASSAATACSAGPGRECTAEASTPPAQ